MIEQIIMEAEEIKKNSDLRINYLLIKQDYDKLQREYPSEDKLHLVSLQHKLYNGFYFIKEKGE